MTTPGVLPMLGTVLSRLSQLDNRMAALESAVQSTQQSVADKATAAQVQQVQHDLGNVVSALVNIQLALHGPDS